MGQRPPPAPDGARMTSDEVNAIVHAYLSEAGFTHAAFSFLHESLLLDAIRPDNSPILDTYIPPGHLIRLLHKALAYLEAEAKYRQGDNLVNPPRLLDNPQPGSPTYPPITQHISKQSANPETSSSSSSPATPSQASEKPRQPSDSSKAKDDSNSIKPVPTDESSKLSGVKRKSSPDDASNKRPPAPRRTSSDQSQPPRKEKRPRIDDDSKSDTLSSIANNNTKKSPPTLPASSNYEQDINNSESHTKQSPANKKNQDTPSQQDSATVPVKSKQYHKSTLSPSETRNQDPKNTLENTRPEIPSSDLSPTSSPGPLPNSAKLKQLKTTKSPTKTSLEKERDESSKTKRRGAEPLQRISSDSIILLKGHSASIQPCSWNPILPSMLATGGNDSTSRVWEVPPDIKQATSREITTSVTFKHAVGTRKSDLACLEWNPDGTLLATGTVEGFARVWTPSGDIHAVFSAHSQGIYCLRWCPDGTQLVTGSHDKTVCLWNISHGKLLQTWSSHAEPILDLDWLDNTTFASCSMDKTIQLFATGRSSPIHRFKGHTDEVNCIRFDSTKTWLASCSDDKTVRIWNIKAFSTSKKDEKVNGDDFNEQVSILRGHEDVIQTLQWKPNESPTDSSILASSSSDGTSRIWDVNTGTCLRVLSRHTDDIYSIGFSLNTFGKYLATASTDKTLCIWRVSDGTLLREYEHPGSIFEIVWHPSRPQVVVCGKAPDVALIDLSDL